MELEDLFSKEYTSMGEEAVPTKSPLLSLSEDLKFYAESIIEISDEIIREGVSDYPIFVASRDEIALGELILDKNELGTVWSVYVSHLEECIEFGVLVREKLPMFKSAFKSPKENICVLVVTYEGANFVFYPYDKLRKLK